MASQVLQILKTYYELFPEFLEQSSIHGLKIFLLSVSARIAKRLWLGFIMLVIILTHIIIYHLTIEFVQRPTELHLSTNMVHIGNTPFPGIAICSANKISRRKLLEYAEQVFRVQQLYKPNLIARNAAELADHLVSLAGFYLHPYYDFEPNDERLERLHNIFAYMYNSTNYPLREVMQSLAPDCEEVIVRALVLGEHVKINDYFVKRFSSSSICCTLNYHRQSYARNITKRLAENNLTKKAIPIRIESNSILNSVQIVIQYDENDVAYRDLSNDAFQLNIFPNEDYPSLQSNTVGELLVEQNSIMEIPIQPRFFASSSSIGHFSPDVRKCYFPEEAEKLLNMSYYSLDECLLVCRMESMIRYCGCVAPPMVASLENVTLCGFMELGCLTKWKGIWYGWNYFDYAYAGTEELKSSYEGCDHCLPTCDGVEFDLDVNTIPLRKAPGSKYTHGILANLSNQKPLAVVKLFFQQRFAQETIEDVVADWVLLLNRFGGILSLMYGFSIISYIEIFYYLTGKWFYHVYNRKTIENSQQRNDARKNENGSENEIPEPPPYHELYWQELKPKHIDLSMFRDSVILQSFKRN